MPHLNLSPYGTPLHQRPTGEIVVTFFIVPLLMGSGLVAMVAISMLQNAGVLGWLDWFGAAWATVMAVVLLIGLPATGWQELRRRRMQTNSERGT